MAVYQLSIKKYIVIVNYIKVETARYIVKTRKKMI